MHISIRKATTMKIEKTKNLVIIGIMTAITCILGPLSIAIPISPVPISFTTLAIFFSAIILGWKKGAISCLIYLLIGLVGLPVFSGFSAGPTKLLGMTGGYLISFVFMALITGFFAEKFKNKIHMYVLGMVIGTILTYTIGTAWLAYLSGMSLSAALFAGVIPYIPGDIAKIIIAAINAPIIKRRLEKNGYL